MSEGDSMYQWSCEDPGITSLPDQIVGALAGPQKSFSENILTPKYRGIFILASLINRSHQVNSRILLVPCFSVICIMKPSDQC